VKDFLFNGVSFFARFAGNSLVFFWLARLLGEAEFGRLSFLFLLANFALVLMDFGLYFLVVEAVLRARYFRIAALLRVKYITSALGLVLMGGVGFALFSLRGQASEDYLPYLLLLLSTAMLVLSQHYLYHFRVRGRYQIETISQTFYSLGILLGVGILAFFEMVSLWTVIAVFVFLRLLMLLVSRKYFSRLHLATHHPVLHWRRISVYLKRSSLYGVTALVGYALLLLDSTLMYLYFPEQLAMYQGGVRVVLMVMMLTEVLTVFFLPRLRGEHGDTQRRHYLLLCILLAVVICVPLWGFPRQTVQLLYGHALEDLVQYLQYFGVVAVLRVGLGYLGTLLTFHGYHRVRLGSLVLALASLLLAAALLMPGHGVAGLLAAVILAHLTAFSYQAWWLRRIRARAVSVGGRAA
jgi:O-antigen/teichoic acid export membrane protein